MSETRPAGLAAAARGALFGASAGGVFATLELGVRVAEPVWSGKQPPAAPLALSGAAILATAWIGLGAASGACVAAATRGRSASPAALATIPLVLAWAAHTIAFSLPQPRLVFVLAGGALALVLALAACWSRRGAERLGFAAHPWALGPLLVGLSVVELDLLRHARVWQQALAALTLSAVVPGAAFGISRLRRSAFGARHGGPRPLPGLVATLALLGVVLATAGSGSRAPLPPLAVRNPSGAPPPIVLVTLDTVRSDHLSVYGYERDTSPRLADFAARATLYRRAIASSDLTLSTHASLFTGLYARAHGARVRATGGATAIAAGVPVLAERLRERGYLTLAVVANAAYLAARYGFDRGFDHYDDRRPPPPLPDLRPHFVSRSLVRALQALGIGDDPFGHAESAYRRAGEINREVFALLDGLPEGAPFLLFANYMDAHWPYDPPPPYDRLFPGRIERAGERPDGETFRAARTLARPYTPAERLHLVSQYDGEIAYVDAMLGELLDGLDTRGLLDPSLVVITSDHGEAFGEHGMASHGVSVYQEQVHVPLLVKWPGQSESRVVEGWVSSVDLLPTVLDLLGEPPPDRLPGRSWLAEDAGRRRPVIAESYPDSTLVEASPRFRRVQRAIFSGSHKLLVPEPGRAELFDLARDPGEVRPLRASAAPGPRLASALEDVLRGLPAADGEAVPVDDATAERLRALGYAR